VKFYTILIFKPAYRYYWEATPNNLTFTTQHFSAPPPPQGDVIKGCQLITSRSIKVTVLYIS